MRLTDVLRRKANLVVTIGPARPVRELLARLAEHRVGALVVSAGDGRADGIASERDVVRRLVSEGDASLDGPVSAIMSTPVHTCSPDDTTNDLMGFMTDHRIRHLPVVADGAMIGIVSIGDVVKFCLADLQSERDQLTAYITG